MLTRRREQIVLLLGLVAMNALLGWRLEQLWRSYQRRTAWIYGKPAPSVAPGLPASARNVAPEQSFEEIVTRNLFRPERNSQLAGEEAKRPELPILYGTMNLGNGWFALMAAGDTVSGYAKRVVPGEEIGGYKLLSIAGSQVAVQWAEKRFTVEPSSSARQMPRNAERSSVSPASAPLARPARAPEVTTVAPVPASSQGAFADEKAKFTPAGYNAPSGAPVDAPPGTIVGGKRKVVIRSPFGEQVFWVDVEKTKQAGTETEKKEKP